MSKFNFKIDITDNSGKAIQAKDEAVERALEAIGLQAEGYAKLLSPVDTGRLRNSLTHQAKQSEKAVYIGTNVEYGKYVEMGTRRSKAQPYLRPAIENHIPEYKKIAENYLKD